MSQDLRIEHKEHTSFITTRTLHSRLWFHKNPKLNYLITAYLAKYQEKYLVKLYFFVLMGNHYHLGADFPQGNRASFMRDLNAIIAKLTRYHVKGCEAGGPLWQRRYRSQALVRDEDRERYFLYAALNPVSSGLVRKLSDYHSGYNSCFDAIRGINRTYTLIDWRSYRDKVRFNRALTPQDFEVHYTLTFSRLPGYEALSAKEYERLFREKIEEERQRLVQEREERGEGFAGWHALKRLTPGALPRSTKRSGRYDPRPLVLTSCRETKQAYLEFYFGIRAAFTECYEALKRGVTGVLFPPGTYHPPLGWVTA